MVLVAQGMNIIFGLAEEIINEAFDS